MADSCANSPDFKRYGSSHNIPTIFNKSTFLTLRNLKNERQNRHLCAKKHQPSLNGTIPPMKKLNDTAKEWELIKKNLDSSGFSNKNALRNSENELINKLSQIRPRSLSSGRRPKIQGFSIKNHTKNSNDSGCENIESDEENVSEMKYPRKNIQKIEPVLKNQRDINENTGNIQKKEILRKNSVKPKSRFFSKEKHNPDYYSKMYFLIKSCYFNRKKIEVETDKASEIAKLVEKCAKQLQKTLSKKNLKENKEKNSNKKVNAYSKNII